MRVRVYGHTGVVGAQLYRWLAERDVEGLSGVSLDRRDGDTEHVPDWAFVCVPTPTTAAGQDLSAVEAVLGELAGQPCGVVMRSTVLPGTCDRIQREHPEWDVYHWPEFLSARTAWDDFCHPWAHIVGNPSPKGAAWLALMPLAFHGIVLMARAEAEMVKYAHNLHGAMQVVFSNLLYDMAQEAGADYRRVRDALPTLGYVSEDTACAYWDVFKDGGRGYGGACFPKDVDAVRHWLAGKAELLEGMAAANARLRGEA